MGPHESAIIFWYRKGTLIADLETLLLQKNEQSPEAGSSRYPLRAGVPKSLPVRVLLAKLSDMQ
jgi:hypothetical protein